MGDAASELAKIANVSRSARTAPQSSTERAAHTRRDWHDLRHEPLGSRPVRGSRRRGSGREGRLRGHGDLAIVDLDRRSRDAAGALLASGPRPGTEIRVAPFPGPERAIGLLAAWRAGFVVAVEPGAPAAQDAAAGTPAQRENMRRVAESRVWSQTPAAVTAAGTTLTHADLIDRLDPGAGPVPAVESLLRYR